MSSKASGQFSDPQDTANFSQRSREKRGEEGNKGPLGWWYTLTAPTMPLKNASLAQREVVRRGRLASIILLAISVFSLFALPFIIMHGVVADVVAHVISLICVFIAIIFNKRGQVTIAGLIVVVSLTASLALSVILPGKMTISIAALMNFFLIPELVTVSLLPAWCVFISAIFNSILLWTLWILLPHYRFEVAFSKPVDLILFVTQPIAMYMLVAVASYLWVNSTVKAIQRADRAEEIAELEQRENLRQQQEIEHRRQLDLGIQQILQTHVEAANGNFHIRTPLSQDNILWQIAHSLNKLLARLQKYAQLETEMIRVKMHAEQLTDSARWTKANHTAMRAERQGTMLDTLTIELNGTIISSSTQTSPTPSMPQKPLTSPTPSVPPRPLSPYTPYSSQTPNRTQTTQEHPQQDFPRK